jgi:hypothetical protein
MFFLPLVEGLNTQEARREMGYEPDPFMKIEGMEEHIDELQELCRDAIDFVRFSPVDSVKVESDGEVRMVTREELLAALEEV